MEHKFIPAGDFQIESSGRAVTFEALLGTCVAVAMYDSTANVGGICHILLPDPEDRDSVWRPKCYASSSLALFVDGLLQNGADRNRLVAEVAGGALGSDFSQHDLNLDIGGRTTECVNSFLKRQTIPIRNSATGGCLGMKLVLDTSSWKVSIVPMVPKSRAPHTLTKPTKLQISDSISNAKPIPQIALKLLRLLQNDNYRLSEVVEELKLDQVLSAKVISFCNSAYISSSMQIDTIERAILVLGEVQLLEIILTTSMKSFFSQREGLFSLIRGGLFKHSLAVANLCKIIARKSDCVDPQTAYSAGLLHDIGKVVLDQYVTSLLPDLYCSESGNNNLITLEKKALGIDHQCVAKELADIWNLPENLKESMTMHHCPDKAQKNPELLNAVYFANFLACRFMAGVELEKAVPCDLAAIIGCIHLTLSDIPEIVSQVQWDKLMYL